MRQVDAAGVSVQQKGYKNEMRIIETMKGYSTIIKWQTVWNILQSGMNGRDENSFICVLASTVVFSSRS